MRCGVRTLSPQARDEFGPENIYEVFDTDTNTAIGWVVIDNTARSPQGTGKGGTAMYPNCDLEITIKKARVMTWKQVFCVPIGKKPKYESWGGAKGGIRWDSTRSDSEEVLRAWGKALFDAQVIPARYIFGLDVGLKEWATRALVQELGDRRVSTGKPTDLGGIPYDELGITGYGMALAMDQMGRSKGIDVRNPKTTIGIQGFGAVGYGTARWIQELYPGGAKVVAASNENGCLYSYGGLSNEELRDLLGKPVRQLTLPGNVSVLNPEGVLYMPLDFLILAYKEDQITNTNAHLIQASIVVEGANRGVSDAAEKFLWQHDILSLTDFSINCGASSIVYVEYADGTIEDGLAYVKEVITTNVPYLLEELKDSSYSPRELAEEIAKSEVRKAMAKR